MGEEAFEYREIMKELKGLPREKLGVVIDFIGYLKAKKDLPIRKGNQDLLSICGILEGPSDMADQHDHYLYGSAKE